MKRQGPGRFIVLRGRRRAEMPMFNNTWDVTLVVAVTAHATLLAYFYRPRWKALLLNLPVPFTFAMLSVGRRVDATNVWGLVLLLGYTYGVWLLHRKCRLNIVTSIALSALGYCAVGVLLAGFMEGAGDAIFWSSLAIVMSLAAILLWKMPYRREWGHRTPLPVWAKAPLVAAVIVFLVSIKRFLGGFMTVFPMVGVVAAYEARRSLWTNCRQIPIVILTMTPMMAVCRFAEPSIGRIPALAAGWAVMLAILVPITRFHWAREMVNRPGGSGRALTPRKS